MLFFCFLQKWRTGMQNRSCLRVWYQWGEYKERVEEVNMVEYYVLIYENGKMRPVETIPGMGGGGIKENDGGGEFNYDILQELL
jgi:hypothetical protein